MKKLYIGGFLIVVMVIGIVFYQQHQLIKSYRSLLYGQLEQLYDAFADVANHTGGGLQMEPSIKEQYFMEYFNIKNGYLQCLNAYIEARTPEKREEAHLQLKEQYEAYQKFLKRAETKLVEPFV